MRNHLQWIFPRLLCVILPPEAYIAKEIDHQKFHPLRHILGIAPALVIELLSGHHFIPAIDMSRHERDGSLHRLICEGKTQCLPALRMQSHVSDCQCVDVRRMTTPTFVEARPLDVLIHCKDGVVCLRRAVQEKVRCRSELVAVYLELPPCPDVTIAATRMVEGRYT